MGSRVSRALEHPRAPLVVALFALAFALPSLTLGFFSDDYALVTALEGHFPHAAPWWDLYRFTPASPSDVLDLRFTGAYPWWVAPGLRLHLVRPLTSALFTLDHALFGHSPVPYHVHSLLWFAALLAGVRALYERILPRKDATLALFVYGVAQATGMPAGWISARQMTIVATAVAWGLAALVASAQRKALRWACAVAMIVALLGAEAGLGGLAFWFAYEAVGPRGGDLAARARRALSPIAIGVAYLGLYALAGGGVRDSDGYVDPMSSPASFLATAAVRVPALLGNAVFTVPAELAAPLPHAPFVVIGLAGASLVAALLRAAWPRMTDEERANVRWLALGALLSILGCAGGFPGARELLVANLGIAAILAMLLRHGFARDAGASFLRRASTGLLALLHVVLAPLMLLALNDANSRAARASERVAERALTAAAGARRYVILSASDPMAAIYPAFVLTATAPDRIECWTDLSIVKGTNRITRTGPASLAVEPVGTSFLRGAFETLYRAHRLPMHAGDEIPQCGAVVRVGSVDDEGRPTRIDVRYDAPLEDPSRVFLAWRNGEMVVVPASEITAGLEIPWTPGPIGMF